MLLHHAVRLTIVVTCSALTIGLMVVTSGCDDDEPPVPSGPYTWAIAISPEAPEAIRWTAEDLERYLDEMSLDPNQLETIDEPTCRPNRGVVVLVGDGLGVAELETEDPTEQTWRVEETRCDDGRLIVLSGGGLLGRQYAAYEWLHALGVRYFHPEEEFVPTEPGWPEEPFVREHTPAIEYRSVSLHLTHPLELGDAFRLKDEQYYEEARRYIDWQIKNGASFGTGGVGDGDLADYGYRRGFPRQSGFSLYGIQQGGRPLIDPDDPRTWQEQLTDALEERMNVEQVPEIFSLTFNPTEFTEAEDTVVVEQLTFIAEWFTDHHPHVLLLATNHGTHGEPTPNYGVRYYDLPQFAPANMGVKVHTLMFYDLFRPAPVYGNEDFGFLYDFMEQEHETRPLWYFPESAWWLTFDNAVPLYLPITIEARDRDIQGLVHMLEGGLNGHRVFGSGHEWGYWQNEYCSYRMAADLDYRWQDCVADMTSPMGDAGAEVAAVLEDFTVQQERDIIYANILAYLVGTDPETEAAASIDIVFHPLPPAPVEILAWTSDDIETWRENVLPGLRLMEEDSMAQVERLNTVEEQIDPLALSFFQEIRDGIEVTALRARHGWQVYGALVLLRESQLLADTDIRADAEQWLADAITTTEAALAVIHRREEGYRYQPLSRSIAGGPDGTEDENWTNYSYRVHNRTHHGYYYTHIDELAAEAFTGTSEAVVFDDALIGPDESLVLRLTDPAFTDVVVRFGDGEESTPDGPTVEHDYTVPGLYTIEVEADRGGEPFTFEATVAVLEQEWSTGFSGSVIEPSGAGIIEGMLPGLVFGPAGTELAIGFSNSAALTVRADSWVPAGAATESTALFENAPETIEVPIVTQSSGETMTSILVEDGVVMLVDEAGPATIAGLLSTEAVIQAVVAIGVGAFDEEGARDLVATLLGYTPDTLPEQVDFEAAYELTPE